MKTKRLYNHTGDVLGRFTNLDGSFSGMTAGLKNTRTTLRKKAAGGAPRTLSGVIGVKSMRLVNGTNSSAADAELSHRLLMRLERMHGSVEGLEAHDKVSYKLLGVLAQLERMYRPVEGLEHEVAVLSIETKALERKLQEA